MKLTFDNIIRALILLIIFLFCIAVWMLVIDTEVSKNVDESSPKPKITQELDR